MRGSVGVGMVVVGATRRVAERCWMRVDGQRAGIMGRGPVEAGRGVCTEVVRGTAAMEGGSGRSAGARCRGVMGR